MSRLVALVLCLLPTFALANDGPTTGSLHLTDLFDLKPGEAGYQSRPPAYDRGGAVLLRPDTSLWRVPNSTPTPTPTPVHPVADAALLPRLPMLISKPREVEDVTLPPFVTRGRLPGEISRSKARLRLKTDSRVLRLAIELTPCDAAGEPTGPPLRLLHAPGSADTFEVEEGSYRLAIEAWQPNAPHRAASRRWAPQRLANGEQFEWTFDQRAEQEFLRFIGRIQD